MKFSYDKQITRWARMGHTKVLMYGTWYDLQSDKYYRVKFNRLYPKLSEIVEVGKEEIEGQRAEISKQIQDN